MTRSYGRLSGTTIAVSCPRVFYLYMKSIARAHMPNKLWERVKLPRNYEKAPEIVDRHLMYWPKTLVHKTKQRLTKMTQMRIRMRKLALKTREKIMTTPRKKKKREARREEKAERAAALDKSIEKELLERLQKGVYGDIYNYPVKEYNRVLDIEEGQAASEDEEELSKWLEMMKMLSHLLVREWGRKLPQLQESLRKMNLMPNRRREQGCLLRLSLEMLMKEKRLSYALSACSILLHLFDL